MGVIFNKIVLTVLFFCFSFFSFVIQTDVPKYVAEEYKEVFDLGNGAGIIVQSKGYFIEDENGNVFYTERTKTQFIDKPIALEGESRVVHEESSQVDFFVSSKKEGSIKENFVSIPKRKEDFSKSICKRRAFMDDAHATLGDTSWIRYTEPPKIPLPMLLQSYGLHASSYIGLANIPKNETEKILSTLSKEELFSIRSAMEELKEKFSSDGNFRCSAKWFSKIGYFENIERGSNKKWKPWTWNRYHYAIENFANHVIEKAKPILSEKIRIAKANEKARVLEREENRRIGNNRAKEEANIETRVNNLAEKLIDKVRVANNQDVEVDKKLENWGKAELGLQQQEGMIFLDKENLRLFDEMRFLKSCKASRMYLKMLKQAEIKYFQNDGNISKKLYNRLLAAKMAIKSDFKKVKSAYILNNYTYRYVPESIGKLEQCYGNEIQHNVHGEIVSLVNRYSYYLHGNNVDINEDGLNLYEAANIALELNNKLDGSIDGLRTKAYERTYSFLDFCHNLLKNKVGRKLVYFWQRVGMGIEAAGVDIKKFLRNGIKDYIQNFNDDFILSDLFDPSRNIKQKLEEWNAAIKEKQQKFGDCHLLSRVREKPLDEEIGDALEFASKTLVKATAIFVASLSIMIAIEAVATVATGVREAISAKRILEPVISEITKDGAAIIERIASSGVSIWQALIASLAEASAAIYFLVDAGKYLYCAMDGGGDKIVEKVIERKPDVVIVGDKNRTIKFEERQLQRKYKHAKVFGIDSLWSQGASEKFKRAILKFINDEGTEVMKALYRKESAIFYINKTTRVFVVEINGIYRTGWRLSKNQLVSFLNSGNLN